MRVLLDTGPLVAMLYRREQHHAWTLEQASTLQRPFYSCEAVITEAHFLLGRVPQGTNRLIELIARGVVDLSFSYAAHRVRVDELMLSFADQQMSFADACLVCMAEQAESAVFTIDTDFRVYRAQRRRPLRLIIP